jgi:hypothetical protein
MFDLRFFINLFLVGGALFALWKGGAAERSAALVVFANVIIGSADRWLGPEAREILRLCNDGLAALALLGVTVRYGAPWMGGVMFFFAAQFALHSYMMVTERAPDYTYALVNNLNWTGITWCLIIGAAVAWRRRHRAVRLAEAAAP